MFFRMFFVLNRVRVSNPQRLTDHPDHPFLNIGQLLPSPVSSERVCKSAGLQVCKSAGLQVCGLQVCSLRLSHTGTINQSWAIWEYLIDT